MLNSPDGKVFNFPCHCNVLLILNVILNSEVCKRRLAAMKMGRSKIVAALGVTLLLAFTSACAETAIESEKPSAVDEKTAEEGAVAEEVDKTEVTDKDAAGVEWGIIEFNVTDPPPADVKSAVVYLFNIEVHKAVAEQEQEQEQEQSGTGNQDQEQEQEQEQQDEGEWITIIETPQSFDLMDVIGVEKLLASVEIAAGKYTQIRMVVDRVEVETVDGESFTAEVPGDKLKIVRPFDVKAGEITSLTVDFDGEKSLIITGKGEAKFRPVVKLLVKEKGKIEAQTKEGKEDEEEGEEELEFEGTIDEIVGDNWTMTIDGESRKVDVSLAEIDGVPEVGLEASVEGTLDGDIIIAGEVEIKETDD